MTPKIREVLRRAAERYTEKDTEGAAALCDIAYDEAKQVGDIDDEILALEAAGVFYANAKDYSTAVARLTSVLAYLKDPRFQIGRVPDQVAARVVQAFAYWADYAKELPELSNDGFDDVLSEGEEYVMRSNSSFIKMEFLHTKSIVLGSLGKDNEALTTAETALALRRRSREPHGCGLDHYLKIYSDCLRKVTRLDDALRAIDEAVNLKPTDVQLWASRAYVKYGLQDFSGSVEDCSEALFLEPKYGWSYSVRAMNKFRTHDFAGSIDDCSEALFIDSKDDGSRKVRALANVCNGDLKSARHDLELSGTDPYAAIWLPWLAPWRRR